MLGKCCSVSVPRTPRPAPAGRHCASPPLSSSPQPPYLGTHLSCLQPAHLAGLSRNVCPNPSPLTGFSRPLFLCSGHSICCYVRCPEHPFLPPQPEGEHMVCGCVCVRERFSVERGLELCIPNQGEGFRSGQPHSAPRMVPGRPSRPRRVEAASRRVLSPHCWLLPGGYCQLHTVTARWPGGRKWTDHSDWCKQACRKGLLLGSRNHFA